MSIAAHVFLQTMRRMDKAAAGEIRHYQAVMLARLIDFAQRLSPDHSPRLVTLVGADGVDLSQWERIPVLTRAELLARPSAFEISERPEALGELSDGRPQLTTGSAITGPADPDFLGADMCVAEQIFERIGLDGRLRVADLVPGGAPDPAAPVRTGWSFQRQRGEAALLDANAAPGDLAAAITTAEATAVLGSIAALERLMSAGGPPAGITHVVGFGFAPADRLAALRAWAATTGAKAGFVLAVPETGAFAMVDGEGKASWCDGVVFHEIVDMAGRPVRPGLPGRLVVTPLYAFTRPLIRFDTGLVTVAGPGEITALREG